MSLQDDLLPEHTKKTMNAMKARRSIKRITFNKTEANPGDTLYVHVPKLNKNEVIVPNSLALVFDIDLSGGHANNFLVQNVSPCISGTTWCLRASRAKICARSAQILGAKKHQTSTLKKKLNALCGAKYRINLDHQIMTDHGVFYPHALYNDLVFEVTLAPASQVVRGSDQTKLKYRLEKIQLQYEMIHSEALAEIAAGIYTSGKEFLYDHVHRDEVISIDRGTEKRLTVKVNAQRRSLKGILLLFIEPYSPGARDSEKYIFPDIKKVDVTINGFPNMLCNDDIQILDIWSEVSRFFMKENHKPQFMTFQKFYTENKFGLLIDLRSMASQEMHGSGTRLVNTKKQRAAGNRERRKGVRNCKLPCFRDR